MITFPRYWPFVREIYRSPVNSPHKCLWRGALMFSLICVWINDWVNNREAGDSWRHRAHYRVTAMPYKAVRSRYSEKHAFQISCAKFGILFSFECVSKTKLLAEHLSVILYGQVFRLKCLHSKFTAHCYSHFLILLYTLPLPLPFFSSSFQPAPIFRAIKPITQDSNAFIFWQLDCTSKATNASACWKTCSIWNPYGRSVNHNSFPMIMSLSVCRSAVVIFRARVKLFTHILKRLISGVKLIVWLTEAAT